MPANPTPDVPVTEDEQMLQAQAGCLPCKLCGGKAIISDAGSGSGYYIACENSRWFRAHRGCLISQQRLGGAAYNVMNWWNRLATLPPPLAPEIEEDAREDARKALKGAADYAAKEDWNGAYHMMRCACRAKDDEIARLREALSSTPENA